MAPDSISILIPAAGQGTRLGLGPKALLEIGGGRWWPGWRRRRCASPPRCWWPRHSTGFSNQGNEVVFCTIGDASTSEGVFWETVNAAGVMQVPLAISVWDDGFGISVPTEKQTTKGNISEVLEGFRLNDEGKGIDIYVCKGWDYPSLCEMYEKGIKKVRATHIPALFHVRELTQPQGHSTSGSHERYKDQARLSFEKEYDCIVKMREWIIDNELATEAQLDEIQVKAKNTVREAKNRAWNNFYEPVVTEIKWLTNCAEQLLQLFPQNENLKTIHQSIRITINPNLSELVHFARNLAYETKDSDDNTVLALNEWIALKLQTGKQQAGSFGRSLGMHIRHDRPLDVREAKDLP